MSLPLTLLLCGDVMLGRGIDQILPRPVNPALHESWIRDARDYVALAERRNGPIPRGVGFDYVWGEALPALARVAPELRIINLETAVTTSEHPWPGKGIHYRMHPANTAVLNTARIDGCVVANNHVLDWGHEGLFETLTTLEKSGIRTAGAGRDRQQAWMVTPFESPAGRLLLFACAHGSSGVPESWAAMTDRPGVALLPDLSMETVDAVVAHCRAARREGDRVVVSIHWGGNWGYDIPRAHVAFAHALIDSGVVDLIHGHSSHHPLGIELYRNRLVLYGCGDLLNDYEGIHGYEQYRGELTLLYLPRLGRDGELLDLQLLPFRVHRFRLEAATPDEALWLKELLSREGTPFGTSAELADGRLRLKRGS